MDSIFCTYSTEEYAELAPKINREDFDANAVAKHVKYAGMKCLVITPKHHDGFAMCDSEVSEYVYIYASPYSKEIVQKL